MSRPPVPRSATGRVEFSYAHAMNTVPTLAWHAVPAEFVLQELTTDRERGLSSAESAARLARQGPNLITVRRARPWWTTFLRQFHTPLVYILIAAAAVTLVVKDAMDSAVIFGVVLANAIIGFVQERKAARAIDALARAMRIEATVRRDGERRRIDAAGLVVGDVVLLEPGDKVPADLRLLDGASAPCAVGMNDLHIDESTLTGESRPVTKDAAALPETSVLADRACMAFASTLVTRGTGMGVVVATGDRTEVGRISGLIGSAEEIATPLTRKIAGMSKVLVWIILGIAGLAFLIGIVRGQPPAEMFEAAVALAVSAIPEGLPAAVTVMLAVGVARMARRSAIIRKLPAVEALGSTTVICSDKTGTLTQNQMTVRAAWAGEREYEITGGGYDPHGAVRVGGQTIRAGEHRALHELFMCGALCNDASLVARADGGGEPGGWDIQGDPTEAALIVAALKLKGSGVDLSREALSSRFPRVDAIPFDSDRQYMATLHAVRDSGAAADHESVVYVKGSVERVLAMCTAALIPGGNEGAPVRVGRLDKERVHECVAAMGAKGLRVLAFARGIPSPAISKLTHAAVEQGSDLTVETEGLQPGLVFLGLQGMLDPPRPEAVEAVRACQRAGVKVKMITGDHAMTAATIAEMVGIEGPRAAHGTDAPPVLTGAQMAAIPDDALPATAESTAVFARMTPEQKLRLVRALQSRGHIVAMTGDGVNDAPALRQADIGVAMGISGTEVSKDAADMVLTDDNFASIEAAVEEGRSVYSNLTKFIVWTLPTNGGQASVLLAAIVLGWPLPILPVQALYINMVTAVLLGLPLIFEAREPNVMSRPPRDPSRPLLSRELLMRTGLVSLVMCAGAMALFHWELVRGMSEEAARTSAVSVVIVTQIFYLFSSRALLRPAWAVPVFSNLWLWGGIVAMVVVQFAVAHATPMNRLFHTAPLDWPAWIGVVLVGSVVLVIVELEKAVRRAGGVMANANSA